MVRLMLMQVRMQMEKIDGASDEKAGNGNECRDTD